MKLQKNGRGDIVMKPRILIAALSALAAIFAGGWSGANAKDAAKAPPLSSIPTFPTENIGREGHFYVGGHYEGNPGKEIMFGAMYVEVMVPKKIQHPYPIIFICGGAGQTAVTVLQTPDGRPGWAYDFLNQGYTVYGEVVSGIDMVDKIAAVKTRRRASVANADIHARVAT